MEYINIWDENAPVIKEGNDFTPYMTFHKAEKSVNKSILILPGGGYVNCCDTYEGVEVAEFFNSFGVDAFVLRYTVSVNNDYKKVYPYPFLDAARAMRYIRSKADIFDINPNCLGIMGFSAGGHLASWISTKWDDRIEDKKRKDDLYDKYSARPDFSVLVYPVIDLYMTSYGVTGENLLGKDADKEMVKSLCSQNNVSSDTPATFIFHTMSDQVVPVMNSIGYYEKLLEKGVCGEMHIFQPGPHGMGIAQPLEHVPSSDTEYNRSWPLLLKNWVLKMI